MAGQPDRIRVKEEWLSNFEMLRGSLAADQLELREKALHSFEKLGFPTTRHEEWKYTSVAGMLKKEFGHAFFPKAAPFTKADLTPVLIPDLKANVLVFLNGFYQAELSDIIDDEKVLQTGNLKDLFQSQPDLVSKHFGQYADIEDEAFTALNTAFAQDGAFLRIPKGKAPEHPVHIIYLTDTSGGNLVYNGRNLFLAEEGSEAKVIITHYNFGDGEGFTNSVTEMVAERNTNLDVYFIQRDPQISYMIDRTQIVQKTGSNVRTVTITLAGKVIRNTLQFKHLEEHCESYLNGLYFLEKDAHVDNHTLVDHAQPNCYSNELYKGVLDGKSTGVFNGKVMVRKDAQKTNAFQSNKNILLSDSATINTKPQLEIFADDVKCSHGATTGMLDKEAMFYLKARGIPEKKAQALLTTAFASDVLDSIRIEPLKEFLQEEVKLKMENRI